jgi:hypothetical protein
VGKKVGSERYYRLLLPLRRSASSRRANCAQTAKEVHAGLKPHTCPPLPSKNESQALSYHY